MEHGRNETCPYVSITLAIRSALVVLDYSSKGLSYCKSSWALETLKYSLSSPLLGLFCEVLMISILLRMLICGISRLIMVDNETIHIDMN